MRRWLLLAALPVLLVPGQGASQSPTPPYETQLSLRWDGAPAFPQSASPDEPGRAMVHASLLVKGIAQDGEVRVRALPPPEVEEWVFRWDPAEVIFQLDSPRDPLALHRTYEANFTLVGTPSANASAVDLNVVRAAFVAEPTAFTQGTEGETNVDFVAKPRPALTATATPIETDGAGEVPFEVGLSNVGNVPLVASIRTEDAQGCVVSGPMQAEPVGRGRSVTLRFQATCERPSIPLSAPAFLRMVLSAELDGDPPGAGIYAGDYNIGHQVVEVPIRLSETNATQPAPRGVPAGGILPIVVSISVAALAHSRRRSMP